MLFFNTGILLVLVDANLSDVFHKGKVFTEDYYDYSPKWYANIGNTLVSTLFLNAFMPIIFEAITNLQRWFFIGMDSGLWCRCGKRAYLRFYETKSRQIYKMVDLYKGPDYIIHFKYSNILNVTYVTMLYGLGLPILFPIALLTYIIFYLVERW